MSLTIRVTNNETGDGETVEVRDGDYLIVVTPPAKLASITKSDEGATHTIVVEGRTDA